MEQMKRNIYAIFDMLTRGPIYKRCKKKKKERKKEKKATTLFFVRLIQLKYSRKCFENIHFLVGLW